jgi:hypothetical protein
MKKIYLSFFISLILSSTAFAFFENRHFPSREVKDMCSKRAYSDNSYSTFGGGSVVQDNRSDNTRKMQYQNCINDWYK